MTVLTFMRGPCISGPASETPINQVNPLTIASHSDLTRLESVQFIPQHYNGSIDHDIHREADVAVPAMRCRGRHLSHGAQHTCTCHAMWRGARPVVSGSRLVRTQPFLPAGVLTQSRAALSWSDRDRSVPSYSVPYRAALCCTELSPAGSSCSVPRRAAPSRAELLRTVPSCSQPSRAIPCQAELLRAGPSCSVPGRAADNAFSGH